MIVITDIKFVEVAENFFKTAPPLADNKGDHVDAIEVRREIINGRRVVDKSRGIDIVVGIGKDPADILGISFDKSCLREK
ncbi:MAG: hypothetical protein M0R03_23500 [Novosphingobium sp.]|jgi:hypothetical protein|nr:hypothetical protein [Novosphingobium sp.]MDD5355023.1 hypothetical protein [Candidatus Omnitrophota bacterium]